MPSTIRIAAALLIGADGQTLPRPLPVSCTKS